MANPGLQRCPRVRQNVPRQSEGSRGKEEPITDYDLTSTQQQLSATLQARLITVTGTEALRIANAAEGQGVEAWRQLCQRFDTRTDTVSPYS